MVADTGATPRPGDIRPLDAPRPVQVEVDNDTMPAAIGTARNKNARVVVHRGSTGSPRRELKNCSPFVTSASSVQALNSSKDGRQTLSYEWHSIREVLDIWRIEDEWWRNMPIVRVYYRVTTEDDRNITIFRDLVDGEWYRQGS